MDRTPSGAPDMTTRLLPLRLGHMLRQIDAAAWRRFFQAVLGLGAAFFLALFATALGQQGLFRQAAVVAFVSLALAGVVGVRVVPFLARRTALRRLMARVEYKMTGEGVVYLLMIAVIAVAALNTGNNLLFMILAVMLAAILASGIISHLVLAGLELDLVLPDHLFAHQPARAQVTLHNTKRLFPSLSITISSQSGARKAKRGKSKTSLAKPNRTILEQPVYIPYIPRRGSVTSQVELLFSRRGRYTQEALRVATQFPFGFLHKQITTAMRREILVLPSVEPSGMLQAVLPGLHGDLESHFRGRGDDLYALRNYQPDDSVRAVDWKATARSGELKVREFAREDDRRILLLFDTWLPAASASGLESFEQAVHLCACMAWHFYNLGVRMQFLCGDFETAMAPAAEVILPALEALAVVEPRARLNPGETAYARLAQADAGFPVMVTARNKGSIDAAVQAFAHVISTALP